MCCWVSNYFCYVVLFMLYCYDQSIILTSERKTSLSGVVWNKSVLLSSVVISLDTGVE